MRWYPCATCGEPTRDVLCGNRLLLRWDASQLPAEQAPALSWRCQTHQRYQLRQAAAVRTSALGDVIYTLTCGHEVHWVFRGRAAYTPTRIQRDLLSRKIRLDQPQRCYRCGDLERKGEQEL